MTTEAILAKGSRALGLSLPRAALEQLAAFMALMKKWNRVFNLTALRDPVAMVSHHLLDSLAVIEHLPPGRLADIGSGAGLPGIPIAIVQPERAIALNDANEKKVAFLRQAVIELRLRNAQVHAQRVETWEPEERFQVVICRGFSEVRDFVGACRHLLAPGGVLAAMKGTYPGAELARVPSWCDCHDVRRLRVPFLEAERHLVLCSAPGK